MQTEHEAVIFPFHTHVILTENGEFDSWCEELNVRADELKEIVQTVGSNIHAVRDFLAKRCIKNESPY